MLHQQAHVFQTGLLREIEPELGKLERDVALNAGLLDGGLGAQIDIPRLGRLLQGSDAFTQVVERDRDAFGIEFAAYCESFIQSLAGHKPGRKTPRQ